jgi:hypothetical protein
MAEWYVKCKREQRQDIIDKMGTTASVTNRWPDGSMNIELPYASQEDKLVELCEDMGIDCELI